MISVPSQLDAIDPAGRGLAFLSLQTEYRTGDADLVKEFYRPCLSEAVTYDRAVGYFRSTVFAVAGYAVIEFAKRGGKIRMVCSPSLTQEDFEALRNGYDRRAEIVGALLEREVSSLLADVDVRAHAETLATLVALGILELRVAVRPPAYGIYHEKIGLFTDAYGHAVTFTGSSNETWQGWHERGNLESFEVFCSWRGGLEADRIDRHRSHFERLWAGAVNQVDVLPFPEAAKRKLCSVAKGSLEEVKPSDVPLPPSMTPKAHQLTALEKWRSRGKRGILAHATGSGKTYTAMLAIREHTSPGNVALVLVPSQLLLDQWETEIGVHIPEAVLLKAGAGHSKWRERGRLESFSLDEVTVGPRIILSTLQTASKGEFQRRLSPNPNLLMVVDEVHQVGSKQYSQCLSVNATARLGLSATPERYGDPDGTQQLMNYFGGVIPPRFLLKDAIEAGLLVEYEYFPHAIPLTPAENDAWDKLTDDIKREIARLPAREAVEFRLSEKLKLLLIQRARIAKKSSNKVPLAVDILETGMEDGQHWLIYCEDMEQLDATLHQLRTRGINANEYHSQMAGDRGGTLDWFKRFGGVLVSIRCLDEGVDIPQLSHAIILASSQNPRQFIQRRGRVLRKAPTKHLAVIHDAIVVPADLKDEPNQVALAKAELIRALEFADSSLNRFAAAEIRDIATRIGLESNALSRTGFEEDDNGTDG